MRIAIDIQTTKGQKVGMGVYVANLIKHLPRVAPQNKYFFFAPETSRDLSVPRRFWWDQIIFPRLARKNKVDILHQPCFSAPMFFDAKIVVTAHDIITMLFPSKMAAAAHFYFSRFMPYSYRFADLIIADSTHTKNDIIRRLSVPASHAKRDLSDKIRVVHLAAAAEFRPMERNKLEKLANKYHLETPFILHVGTLEPRKNLEFLIKAYYSARKNEGLHHKLVITGKKGWHYQDLFRQISALKLEKEIIFTGYIPDEEMPGIYNLADLFVFPSLYEGFGLPPLEAMASGVPVICSDTSSLPEVVGKAGILLPPKDLFLWQKTIAEVLKNKKFRQKMSAAGRRQAKKFSWEKCARETLEVYRELMKK